MTHMYFSARTEGIRTFRHPLRAAYRTAITAAQILVYIRGIGTLISSRHIHLNDTHDARILHDTQTGPCTIVAKQQTTYSAMTSHSRGSDMLLARMFPRKTSSCWSFVGCNSMSTDVFRALKNLQLGHGWFSISPLEKYWSLCLQTSDRERTFFIETTNKLTQKNKTSCAACSATAIICPRPCSGDLQAISCSEDMADFRLRR